jgi:adenosylhomocysteinase
MRLHHAQLKNQVYTVPAEIAKEVARFKLEAIGIKVDALSDERERYLTPLHEGTRAVSRSESTPALRRA